MNFEAPVDVLERALNKLAGADTGCVLDGDGHAIVSFNAPMGAAFTEWLAGEVQDQRASTRGCSECDGRGLVSDGDPIPFDCPDCTVPAVMRIARELLRGDPS